MGCPVLRVPLLIIIPIFLSLLSFISYALFMTLFSKLFHVRQVTQGDVIRADAKEIPRIFQVI